jgi:hypothetical protein
MGKIPLNTMTLRYNGLFDFDGLYSAVIDWAKNYGFVWIENAYKHKVPSPAGAEQEFMWTMTQKVNDYVSYSILMIIHMWEMTEVQVNVGGRKRNLSNARLYIVMVPTITTDWQGKFNSPSKFIRTLGEWYEGKVKKKDIESGHGDALYYRTQNLHALIKKYFDMQTKKYEYKNYLQEN